MATGLPVLAASTGGIPEVVSEDTGFLIDPNDPDNFCRTVQELLRNPAAWESKIKQARKLVETKFQAEKLIQRKIELLSSVLNL